MSFIFGTAATARDRAVEYPSPSRDRVPSGEWTARNTAGPGATRAAATMPSAGRPKNARRVPLGAQERRSLARLREVCAPFF